VPAANLDRFCIGCDGQFRDNDGKLRNYSLLRVKMHADADPALNFQPVFKP
jgi:hypothetical protein